MSSTLSRTAALVLSIALLLLIGSYWRACSRAVRCRDPLTVVRTLWSGLKSGELPYNVGVTLARVFASFLWR